MGTFSPSELFDLSGRLALVTGATRGLGRILAQALVENGVRTYVTGRDQAAADRTAAALSARGGVAIGLGAELATVAGARGLAACLAERESKLDILINNAGVFTQAAIEDVTESQFDYDFGLNTRTPFFLVQATLPLLRAAATRQSPARVVNVASGAGQFVGGVDMFTYGASKAALIHLTQSMAAALAASNITINAITPGVVETEVSREYTASAGDVLFASIPTKRFTSPAEIAGTVLYLCGRAGANTTGQVVCADGGQTVMPVVRA
jgi:NAD(P)-dependent dehydrogenase (short-subunit alcohol dehydrogenase family)